MAFEGSNGHIISPAFICSVFIIVFMNDTPMFTCCPFILHFTDMLFRVCPFSGGALNLIMFSSVMLLLSIIFIISASSWC